MPLTINDILPNQIGEILSIEDSHIKSRMLEMGFQVGQSVKVLFKAPLSGPVAIQILDCILALREEEADLIKIKTK